MLNGVDKFAIWYIIKYRGGIEPPPVIGHLDDGEPIVKPTLKGRFLFFWGREMMLMGECDCQRRSGKTD